MSYLINPYRYASAGCDPDETYTGLALTQAAAASSGVYACHKKPILTAASVSHSVDPESDLKFWINCTSTHGGSAGAGGWGNPACTDGAGDDLLSGVIVTLAELLAGVDLNALDEDQAPLMVPNVAMDDYWTARVWAINTADCNTSVCSGDAQGTGILTPHAVYDGPALYTDGSGAYPQFKNGPNGAVSIGSGSIETYAIQINQSVLHYASAGLGEDSFGSTAYKIFLQYDTSCDTSGGCGSYSWQDGDDNDTFFAAGSGGAGNEQTFTLTEAECWDEDYIFVRFKVEAQGGCGSVLADSWSSAITLDVSSAGGQCMGGP